SHVCSSDHETTTRCTAHLTFRRDSVKPFFFSSRRRHTRSKRDWSSDVCSSDLLCCNYSLKVHIKLNCHNCFLASVTICTQISERSEERRVGKECRTRWSSAASKRNVTKGATGKYWEYGLKDARDVYRSEERDID